MRKVSDIGSAEDNFRKNWSKIHLLLAFYVTIGSRHLTRNNLLVMPSTKMNPLYFMFQKHKRSKKIIELSSVSMSRITKERTTGGSAAAAAPSIVQLQWAARAVLAGKRDLNRADYLKLKRQHKFLPKLATIKGSQKSKQAFLKRNKKQVGGFMGLLPHLIKGAMRLLPAIINV